MAVDEHLEYHAPMQTHKYEAVVEDDGDGEMITIFPSTADDEQLKTHWVTSDVAIAEEDWR